MYFYTGPPNWVFSAFAFVGFLCSSIPLTWHLEAWNTGTCLYMIWTGVACLIFFIDSIVWSGNVIDWSPTWCDLSTHFLNGFNLAIPACSLCINRRLYQIVSVRNVGRTQSTKRNLKTILIDLAICLLLPLLQIPLQYIVQGHRYNIFEDVGCLGETFETPVSIILFHVPPILLGLVSAIYCVFSIKASYHRRAEFKELLSLHNNLNLNRYVRLMLLASTDLFITTPLACWVLWVNVGVNGLSPWISWKDTHSNFSRVERIPGILWRADPLIVASLETLRWATVACALIFFAYFGFADKAIESYRSAFFTVTARLGYSPAVSSRGAKSKPGARSTTLPIFIHREITQRHDSFNTLCDTKPSSSGIVLSKSGPE
ncbi:pheromone B alpha 1 receptor [Mycena galericulata]|nr:pheromone B alpha 1 receptor [Mycena galericulata]